MEGFPQLQNLIQKGTPREKKERHQVSEEKRLELRLGPPGEDQLPLSLSCMPSDPHNNTAHGAKRGFQDIIEAKTGEGNWLTNINENQHRKLMSFSDKSAEKVCSYTSSCGPLSPFPSSSACQEKIQKQSRYPKPSFLEYPFTSKSVAVMEEDSPQPCSSRVAEWQCPEKQPFSTPNCSSNTAEPNSSQKRIALGPTVGWPPVGSFRKNLATSSSSKPPPESPNKIGKDIGGGKLDNFGDSLFVKINMDGVPIGRKVDLKAYSNYEQLSSAVDELFRCLLAARRDSSATLNDNEMEETKAIKGLLDGNGEYTLVYKDSEGDRMLVGDVPWHTFISSAKRLRVLKRSELSAVRCEFTFP